MALDPQSIPLTLYIHIPWCERKCPYCDFNSHENFSPEFEQPYVDALLSDLALQREALQGRVFGAIFIGGGTPSLFGVAAIGTLLEGVAKQAGLATNCEITLESNPSSAAWDRYRGYRAAGVNRLSIGVQSFNEKSLQALGRVHDREQARHACKMASSVFERFNIDIMHGLPEQTTQSAMSDLNEAIDRCGGHLSWYQLTIEPNTVFYSKPPIIPIDDTLADIQDAGEETLERAGFTCYEVSAWSEVGQESRHNLNYWQFGDYLGIGAGAHGKISQPDGTVVRLKRTRKPADYLAAIARREPATSTQIDRGSLTAEFMLNALRLKRGVASELYTARTGLKLGQLETTLSHLKHRKLLELDSQRLCTTPLGFRFLNDVTASFLPE